MSSVYSSNKSRRVGSHPLQAREDANEEQRAPHGTSGFGSPERQAPVNHARASEVLADLIEHNNELLMTMNVQTPQTLWKRRRSTKGQRNAISPVEGFSLDLLDEYRDEKEPCISPAMSERPPRTTSLVHSPVNSRSLSLDTNLDQQANRIVSRPHKGLRHARPKPFRASDQEVIPDHTPQSQSARTSPTSPSLVSSPADAAQSHKKHRRHMTISESKRAARNTIIVSHPSGMMREHDLPPLPGLSPSNSTTTSALSPAPGTPMSIFAPTEDQIRRELEILTLQDGADPLLSHRYGGKAEADLVMDFDVEPEDFPEPNQRRRSPLAKRDENATQDDRSQLRRRKSFVEYFHRRSAVDKLLDLYLDDDRTPVEKKPPDKPPAVEKPSLKRKQSFAKRMTMSLRTNRAKSPEVPPVPPLMPMPGPVTMPAPMPMAVEVSRFSFD